MNEVILTPAYGRRYARAKEMKAAWNAGKDFKIFGGPYCSVRDAERMKADGWTTVHLVQFRPGGNALEWVIKL